MVGSPSNTSWLNATTNADTPLPTNAGRHSITFTVMDSLPRRMHARTFPTNTPDFCARTSRTLV